MSPLEPSPPVDHGQVVRRHKAGLSWVWFFPALALAVSAWFFWKDYQSLGPEITVTLDEAPGITAGKTPLIYRGVEAGTVHSVRLDTALDRVIVGVRLKEFARGLATENTDFWVERPVITLAELTGLESIITGNSMRASNPGGNPCFTFRGLAEAPLLPLQPGSFTIRLRGLDVPFLNRGTPVYHRGVNVGYVREKKLTAEGAPLLELLIEPAHRDVLRTTSRFWPQPATSLTVGQHGFNLRVEGVDALVQGAICFDHFDNEGLPASNDSVLPIVADEFTARCSGSLATITFESGRGIVPGRTPVCHLGVPVGLVESVSTDSASGLATVSVRLLPAQNGLLREGSVFTLVRPRISLEGVSNLDTLITGSYIEIEPSAANVAASEFSGRTVAGEEWEALQAERHGVPFQLHAESLPSLDKGAPVFHKGLVAGSITRKTLDSAGRPCLEGVIRPSFRGALTQSARFWRVPATSIKAGPGYLQMDVNGVQSLLQGGVAFENMGPPKPVAPSGSRFPLQDNHRLAQAVSEPVNIRFLNGRGLRAGETELRYLGVPVGVVEAVETSQGRVCVKARFNEGYDFLRQEGSIFSLVRPNISLQGVTGLETLISGVYIECTPGSSHRNAAWFEGRSTLDAEEILQSGLTIKLTSRSTPINVGASIFYRGIGVGRVTAKSLSPDGREIVLTVIIEKRYRHLVRENSRFWNASGIKASLGVVKFRIQTESIMAPDGRISFSTPENTGPVAKEDSAFELFAEPRPEWLKWNPSIPIDQ